MSAPQPAEVKLLPAYTLAEAARYLGTNATTLGNWFGGRNYSVGGEQRRSEPVFRDRRQGRQLISFLDLVEAHILLGIRRGYGIPLKQFRTAMEYLREIGGDLHFLAHRDFYHDRTNLFVKLDDKLVSLSERGQMVDHGVISEGLRQLQYGADGYTQRFFPRQDNKLQELIALDPSQNFGKPCLSRLGVGADAVAARFFAGEKLDDLAEDYGATKDEVEEAIRWHERLAA